MADVTLSEAAERFFQTLKQASQSARAEVNRFIEWFGREHPVGRLRGHDIELYAEQLGPANPDTTRKADHVRSFLTFLNKAGIAENKLASHLRLRKGSRGASAAASRFEPGEMELTQEGVDSLRSELLTLVAQRPAVREEIHRAMLDKDFRENAPLDAAKDKQGHLEARIRDIEATLKRAVVVHGSSGGDRVRVGATVVVQDLKGGPARRWAIVRPTEANAKDGKICSDSPVGKALLNKRPGDEVEVTAPSGVICYRVEEVQA